ncbi:immunoglobulin domain-containing protein [Flavobacterium sp. P21]|uniref:immunoglobulin domain-containing protein n=1 Tax=Flavobacterium sp. P21 TaxID=3423948 RepID=UPI003D67515B
MPGDVYPQISTSTSLTMLSITETKAPDICGSGTTILEAKSATGTINWYIDETGSSLIATGPNFTTPILNTNETYYVATEYNGCFSKRIPVDVRVNKVPEVTFVSNPAPECGSGIFF